MRNSNFFLDRRIRTGYLVACLAAFANPARALDPQRAMSQYGYEHWGPERGFPSGPRTTQGELLAAVMQRGTTVFRRNKFEMTSDASGLREALESRAERSAALREHVFGLADGPYRLGVVASNPEGVWNSSQSVFAFDIEPLWQAWWFRAACLAGAIAGLFAIYRIHLGRVTRRLNLRAEERLAERTRIAEELHDALLQGFLSTSMQVHVAADRLPDDSPAKPILNRALQLMRQVIEEGRNAVRGLRSSRSAMLDLEEAFALLQQEVMAGAPPGPPAAFRVVVVGGRRPLHPLLRDDVYRIGREALMNAFRHARARNIEIELKYLPRQFRVVVRDDGCGIDPEILKSGRDGHWGLPGMQEKAAQLGARLKVWSRIGGGTEVELSVPGYVAFEDYPTRWFTWLRTPVSPWNGASRKWGKR